MKYMIIVILLSTNITGCGLGETAVSGAAGASVQVRQAKEGRTLETRAQGAADAAVAADAERRRAAEAAAQ